MLQKKLKELGHPYPHLVDLENRQIFASTVIWLEDQQIRRYKIEDRINLRKIDDSKVWEVAYKQYKTDIGMPRLSSSFEEMSWLLNYSMSLDDDDDDGVIVLSSSSETSDKPDPFNDAFLETDWHRIPNPFAKVAGVRKRKKKISAAKKKQKNYKDKLKVDKFMRILKTGEDPPRCPPLISVVKHNSSPRIVSLPKCSKEEACSPNCRMAIDIPRRPEASIKLPLNRPGRNVEMVVYNFNHKEGCIPRVKREKFKKALNDALDAFLKANLNQPLKFTNANFKSGRYHVICGNECSVDCLTTLIDGLTNWENTNLGVIPVPYWLKLTRVTVWIPGALEKPSVLLKRLTQQNSHITTKDWKIYHTKPTEGLGQLLVLGIDEESLKSLNSSGGKVQCGFNRVQFKIVPSKE